MTNGRRYRVLVVDDEPDIRLIVGLNIGLLGMEFGEAANGGDAIDMLRSGDWDACILDLAMPNINGFEVLKELRKDGSLDSLAMVVLSAKTSPAAAMQAMRLGAHMHLTKPFSPAAVARTTQELIELTPEERDERRRYLLERAGRLEQLGMPTV